MTKIIKCSYGRFAMRPNKGRSMRKILATLLTLLTVAVIGCGDDGGGRESFVFTGTAADGTPTSTTFQVNLFPGNVPGATVVKVQALDANGDLVFGPKFVNIDDQLKFQLPNGSREIQIAYGDGSKTLCVYQQLLPADVSTDINAPSCIAVSDFITGISLTPEESTIAVGATQQYRLEATLVNGTTTNIINLIALGNSAPTVANVNGSGLATGAANGSTTLTANVFFYTDSAVLNVNTAPTLRLQSNADSVQEGDTLPVNALRMVDGTETNVNDEVTWDSSNDATATVDDTGLVTGVAFSDTPVTISAFDPVTGLTATTDITVTNGEPQFSRIEGNFEDISATGTELMRVVNVNAQMVGDTQGGRDDGAEFVTIPFDFTLLGDTFYGFWVSTNGYLTTDDTGNGDLGSGPTDFAPIAIPNVDFSKPHNLIAAFYDDLDLRTDNVSLEDGGMWTQVLGEAPNRRAIFQWKARSFNFNSADSFYSFEIKLFEGTNRIEFHYQDITVANDPNSGVANGLIGVMNDAGTEALTWIFEGMPMTGLLVDGDALRYLP